MYFEETLDPEDEQSAKQEVPVPLFCTTRT
jgi:hypothetical protein